MQYVFDYVIHGPKGPLNGTVVSASLQESHWQVYDGLGGLDAEVRLNWGRSIAALAYREALAPAELSRLYRVLSDRLRAGLSLPQGLNDAEEFIDRPRSSVALSSLRTAVLGGSPIADAMLAAGFPMNHIQAIRAVHDTGQEARVFQALAEQIDVQIKLKARVTGLIWYPTLVFVFMWIVMWGVTLFIAPRLAKFFGTSSSLGIQVPSLAAEYYRFAVAVSEFPRLFSCCWFALPIVAVLIVRNLDSARVTRVLPPVANLRMKLELIGTWSAFLLMYEIGMRPVEIFTTLARAASLAEHRERLEAMANMLRSGTASLAVVARRVGWPASVATELAAAESAQNYKLGVERVLGRLHSEVSQHCDQIEHTVTVLSYLVIACMVVATAGVAVLPQLLAAFAHI